MRGTAREVGDGIAGGSHGALANVPVALQACVLSMLPNRDEYRKPFGG